MVVSITGLLVMAVFFAAMLDTFRSNLVGDMLVGTAIKEATYASGERNRTEIGITGGPTLSASSVECTLRMTGDNTGATSMFDFSSIPASSTRGRDHGDNREAGPRPLPLPSTTMSMMGWRTPR